MSIIADVCERFGRYDAALERQFNAEQQKPAPTLPPLKCVGRVYKRLFMSGLRDVLCQDQQKTWWDYPMLIRATGFKNEQVRQAARLLMEAGEIEQVMMPKTTRGGSYRAIRLVRHSQEAAS